MLNMKLSTALSAVALGSALINAQVAEYGQCGGISWTDSTTCASPYVCSVVNAYYSQCVPGSASATTAATTSSTAAKTSSSTTAAASATGVTYTASFTEYGSTDSAGSGNCNVLTTACGYYTSPGYNAAASQNLFGVGPGVGAGPGCGGCWQLTGKTDSSGNALSNPKTIVVKVTNLCPANGNALCAQSSLTSTNQYGAEVNFDLCIDSGASAAFLDPSGVGLAVGTATSVDCSAWSGTVVP
ncbi:glycoside hydrolase family 45 protein [Athelia psychrophila]|uniref:Glycoside hydrolase family 45 protein n=1 Tax=Athelia psychrophila TaxID=1759441 RepID=A0A166GK16_9AGAM|nr:glycoside hydrolase family 45 protein [Fibularhizoctonia sp. CBS 109695]